MSIALATLLCPAVLAAPDPAPSLLSTAYGTHFEAYVAGPVDATGGVLLLHDRLGLDATVRAATERLAALGYRVIAADLYGRRHATDWSHGGRIMRSIDPESAVANVRGALTALKAPGRKLAIVGWDYGGTMALRGVLEEPTVAGAVTLYAPPITDPVALRRLQTPVLGLYGRTDPNTPPPRIEAFVMAARQVGAPLPTVVNLDAGLGFANPRSPGYNATVAEESWGKIEAFLAERLK